MALALLSMAVAASGALSSASARINIEAGQRSQATALADRELEAIRLVRANLQNTDALWSSYAPAPGVCADYVMRRSGDDWVAVTQPDATPVPYDAANSGESATFVNNFSGFSRNLHVCGRAIRTGSGVTGVDITNLVTVTATVTWNTAKVTNKVTSHTMLTDWKP